MKKVVVLAAVVCAVTMMGTSAFAASPLRAVGLEAGYVSPDTDGGPSMNTWIAGLYADFGLPMQNLYVNPFVNYWNWSDGDGSAETSFHDWSVGANVKWNIPTAGKIAMREYGPPLCPAAGPGWGIPLDLIVAGTNG